MMRHQKWAARALALHACVCANANAALVRPRPNTLNYLNTLMLHHHHGRSVVDVTDGEMDATGAVAFFGLTAYCVGSVGLRAVITTCLFALNLPAAIGYICAIVVSNAFATWLCVFSPRVDEGLAMAARVLDDTAYEEMTANAKAFKHWYIWRSACFGYNFMNLLVAGACVRMRVRMRAHVYGCVPKDDGSSRKRLTRALCTPPPPTSTHSHRPSSAPAACTTRITARACIPCQRARMQAPVPCCMAGGTATGTRPCLATWRGAS